jgi:hypothetical protein
VTQEPHYVAPRDLYLDKGGGVVEATDPARMTLLVRAGGTLAAARARELGLPIFDGTLPVEVTEGQPTGEVLAPPVGADTDVSVPTASDQVLADQPPPPDPPAVKTAQAPRKQKSGAAKARARKAKGEAK